MQIRRLVVDVLIPYEPNVLAYAESIGDVEGVAGVTIRVTEVDEKTRTLEMTIEGESLSFEAITKAIEELGGAVHSIDEVSAGGSIVEPK
ncbi:MAG: DUF211 domain-containing protein [Chloroflexota bacterium]